MFVFWVATVCSSALKIEATYSSETTVPTYKPTRCYYPEYQHRRRPKQSELYANVTKCFSAVATQPLWRHVSLAAMFLAAAVSAQDENKWVWAGNARSISAGEVPTYTRGETSRQLYRY
jgi:hypothetical protein